MAFSYPQDPLQTPERSFAASPARTSPQGRCSGPAAPLPVAPTALSPGPALSPSPLQVLPHPPGKGSSLAQGQRSGGPTPPAATRGRHVLDVELGCIRASYLGSGSGDWGQKRLTVGCRLLGFLRALPGGYWEPTPQVRNRPETGMPPSLALGKVRFGSLRVLQVHLVSAVLPPPCCVTLEKSPDLSGPQFLHL